MERRNNLNRAPAGRRVVGDLWSFLRHYCWQTGAFSWTIGTSFGLIAPSGQVSLLSSFVAIGRSFLTSTVFSSQYLKTFP